MLIPQILHLKVKQIKKSRRWRHFPQLQCHLANHCLHPCLNSGNISVSRIARSERFCPMQSHSDWQIVQKISQHTWSTRTANRMVKRLSSSRRATSDRVYHPIVREPHGSNVRKENRSDFVTSNGIAWIDVANSLFQRISILFGRSMLYRTERQSADTVKSRCAFVSRGLKGSLHP